MQVGLRWRVLGLVHSSACWDRVCAVGLQVLLMGSEPGGLLVPLLQWELGRDWMGSLVPLLRWELGLGVETGARLLPLVWLE